MNETKPLNEQTDACQLSERTRRWLLFGLFAALIDGSLQVVSTVLELRFWEDKGLTPETAVGFVAILPQLALVAAYLAVARDLNDRGLWKGAAGFFACGWLGLFLDLVTYDVVPQSLTIAGSIAGGIGILGLAILLFGKWPTFPSEQTVQVSASEEAKDKGLGEPGCLGYFILGAIFFAIKTVLKRNRQWLWWVGDVESWAFLEMVVILILMTIFGVWFALAKIRLRHKLGGMATLLGSTELLIAALHLAMLAIGLSALILTVIENPNIEEAAMDKLYDSKVKTAIVASAASYCVWSVMTMLFFASVIRPSDIR